MSRRHQRPCSAQPPATPAPGARNFIAGIVGGPTRMQPPAAAVYTALAAWTIAFRIRRLHTSGGNAYNIATQVGLTTFAPSIWLMYGDLLAPDNAIVAQPNEYAADALSVSDTALDGQWHHVAVTWNSAGDARARIFVDGVQVGYTQQDAVPAIPANAGAAWAIGDDTFGGGAGMDLCQFAQWSTVLSDSDILALSAPSANPAAFGGGSLALLLRTCGVNSPEPDSSGHGNNAVLTGPPAPVTGPPGVTGC